MKPRFSHQRNRALTITEVLVSVAVVCLFAAIVLADSDESQAKYQRTACVNNLKQVGIAYRLWANDNNDKYPMQVSVRKGGARELVVKGNVAACFQVMSNILATPKLLICPADTSRFVAENFTTGFNNSKVSYFVGIDARDVQPRMFLSGDDNLAIDGVPVKPGLLLLATNAPVNWTAARHVNQGNIGLADGGVQQVNTESLQQALQQTGVATNRLAIP